MRASALLIALPLAAGAPQAPRFTVKDAVRAEWARALPELDPAKLSPEDRARYERSQRRIEAPGMPTLLPPELANPTLEVWEAKAKEAKTPQERVTALHFLNRLKSSKALRALEGLKVADAATWPKHLHLDAALASARLNGAEVSPELQTFLDALQKAGKGDPVRAQAARLRLVMGGKEKELLPPVKATAGKVLAMMDAWNRAPKPAELGWFGSMGDGFSPDPRLPKAGANADDRLGLIGAKKFGGMILHRLLEGGIPAGDKEANEYVTGWATMGSAPSWLDPSLFRLIRLSGLAAMAGSKQKPSPSPFEINTMLKEVDPIIQAPILSVLRTVAKEEADRYRTRLISGPNAIARAAAIEDCPTDPPHLDQLVKRVWDDAHFESQQVLLQSFARWKWTEDAQRAQLLPWLRHPNWSCRFEAYKALVKLDPTTPWPAAPKPTPVEAKILKEAERLAEAGKPVRLRLRFSGKRTVVLRLDPTVAPINVANLVLLARKGFFNGRRVPRVVPDFVVQMGSPFDTMDGGPGYTVRCENSLAWYGPGSVGMALSGKDTGGSQFFITTNATPHLTGKYTRLGEVEDLDRALPLLDDLELGAKLERVEVLGSKGN